MSTFKQSIISFMFIFVTMGAIPSAASINGEETNVRFELNCTLLKDIEVWLGVKQREVIEKHIPDIEEALLPMFLAMPKNGHENLGHAAVRYVLHRLFMQHGWSVRGLEPAGETWNSGSPIKILRNLVPEYVQNIFEEQLFNQGFGLREIAVLAATFKHLVRDEMAERVRAAYRANNIQYEKNLDEIKLQQILDTYMASIIGGENISSMNPHGVQKLIQDITQGYPFWAESRLFARHLKLEVIGNGALNLHNVNRLIVEIEEKAGPWRKAECLKRKHELIAIEDKGSGRVRLSNFYSTALYEGKPHFGENSQYLQQLGALDDSNPDDLRVIIPNWVNGLSNCYDASKYYSICCISECEELLEIFEGEIKASSATPAEIVKIIAALPAQSAMANRTLPTSLVRRLDEVASMHNGRVPLHGRLFSQWMHHAYPHECPFPHVAGTTHPQRVSEWEGAGNEVVANEKDMLQHIDKALPRKPHPVSTDKEMVPWLEEEELLEPVVVAPEAAQVRKTPRWVTVTAALLLLVMQSGASFEKLASLANVCTNFFDKRHIYNL